MNNINLVQRIWSICRKDDLKSEEKLNKISDILSENDWGKESQRLRDENYELLRKLQQLEENYKIANDILLEEL